jgi:hypothetical protein
MNKLTLIHNVYYIENTNTAKFVSNMKYLYLKTILIIIFLVTTVSTVIPAHQGDAEFIEIFKNRQGVDTWVITGTEIVKDAEEIWSDDIRVEAGGALIIDNSKISFYTEAAPILINVTSGGVMKIINNTEFNLINISTSRGYYIWNYGELEIDNSTIMFAGYCAPLNTSGCTDPTPSDTAYGPGIWQAGGELTIRNSVLGNSTYAVFQNNGKIAIDGSTFENNFYGIYGYKTSDITINNAIFQENYYGLFLITVDDVEITDSIFARNLFGIFSEDSKITVVNGTFNMNTETAVSAYRHTELTLIDSLISYNWGEYPGYNLFMETSTLVMHDSRSENGLWGLYLMNCSAELLRTELVNNQFVGAYLFRTDTSIKNSTFSGNGKGVLLENSTGALTGSDIVDNTIGLYTIESAPALGQNTIADNTEFGVYAVDMSYNVDSSNKFIDSENRTNGIGRYRQIYTVYARVTDFHNNLMPFVEAEVTDGMGNVVFNDNLYVKGTVSGGKLLLVHYWITNSGERIEPNPYNITVQWSDSAWSGQVSSSKEFTVDSTSPKIIELSLGLPDLYIYDDDISVSSDKITEGDSVEITVNVHRTGTLQPQDINLSVYINDEFHEEFEVGSFGSAMSKSIVFTAKASADEKTGMFRVQVEIDDAGSSQFYYVRPYNSNNTAEQWYEVEEPDDDTVGWVKYIIFVLAIIVFLIAFVLVTKYVIVVKSPSGDERKEEGRSQKEEGGKGDKEEDREEAVRRDIERLKRRGKVEPPEMVRRL